MGIVALEGVVDQNRIRLKENIRLPEKTKVYVLVPDMRIEQIARVASPRLLHPEQAGDFTMEVAEEPPRARL